MTDGEKAVEAKAELERLEGLTLDQLKKENGTLRYEQAQRRLQNDALTKEKEEADAAQKLKDDEEALKKGEFESLYTELKTSSEDHEATIKRLNGIISNMLDAEIAAIPEDKRAVVEAIHGVEAKLEFIAAAKKANLFATADGLEIRDSGEPGTGDGINPWDPKTRNLTEQGKIMIADKGKARRLAALHGTIIN